MNGSARVAWYVGVGIGVIAGVFSAMSGFVSGVCCLFQFAQMLVPLCAALVAGGVAAGMAPWGSLERGTNPVLLGAGYGLRAGFTASFLSGSVGVALALVYPALMVVAQIVGADDPVSAMIGGGIVFVMQALWATGFACVGAAAGTLLAVAFGAILGAVVSPRQ